MTDKESTAEEERTAETDAEAEIEAESEAEATVDIEAAEERERSVAELEERISEQQERIEELENVMLDMSARSAHDGGTGVCPDCHGPVIKTSRWFRSPKIKCTECGNVFHEY
jgi:hydrogenase maturation factor HypF (carbamoyltransferase family)